QNPFNFTNRIDENMLKIPADFYLDNGRIDELIKIASGDSASRRKWAVRILAELRRFGVLAEDQLTAFIDAVWSSVDKQGFPENTDFYKFAWCLDMSPAGVQGEQFIKQYILDEEFPTQRQSSKQG